MPFYYTKVLITERLYRMQYNKHNMLGPINNPNQTKMFPSVFRPFSQPVRLRLMSYKEIYIYISSVRIKKASTTHKGQKKGREKDIPESGTSAKTTNNPSAS